MIISICIPCKNRTYDLKQVLPALVNAANFSPPVEIAILNYNSHDDLEEYLDNYRPELATGNTIKRVKFDRWDYYHMAHAKNCAALASSGEYFLVSCADVLFKENFVKEIREIIKTTDAKLIKLKDHGQIGLPVIEKKEFIEAGGYDERFEFYGPEDKDLMDRLKRRNVKEAYYPQTLFSIIPTPPREKTKYYRIQASKWKMTRLTHPIYHENDEKGLLVANPNGWGQL